MKQYNLNGNPFEFKTVHDIDDFSSQPFLLTNTQKNLKTKIELNKTSKFPIYVLLLGERGAGKSSSLLFSYKSMIENKNGVTAYYSNKIIKETEELYRLINPNARINRQGSISSLKEYVQGRKIFLFFDMPDKIPPRTLDEFLSFIEGLLDIKEISLIMAMNKGYYNQSFDISEIFGKYTIMELEPFNFEETEEIIRERLKSARIVQEESLKPFCNECIKHIFNFSGGIPRNIISACDLLIINSFEKGIEKIDENFASKILQTDFSYKIINERIKEQTSREMLMALLEIIRKDFKGFISKENDLSKIMKEKMNWAMITTRKRIRILEKLGLVEIKKSPDDFWSNQITLRC